MNAELKAKLKANAQRKRGTLLKDVSPEMIEAAMDRVKELRLDEIKPRQNQRPTCYLLRATAEQLEAFKKHLPCRDIAVCYWDRNAYTMSRRDTSEFDFQAVDCVLRLLVSQPTKYRRIIIQTKGR